jgi:hypothetical protein
MLERPGRRAQVKVARAELVVLVFDLESGGAGPHLHRHHVDSFYGDHTGEPVRFLNIHSPGMRFDEYIRRMDAGEKFDHTEYDSWPPF